MVFIHLLTIHLMYSIHPSVNNPFLYLIFISLSTTYSSAWYSSICLQFISIHGIHQSVSSLFHACYLPICQQPISTLGIPPSVGNPFQRMVFIHVLTIHFNTWYLSSFSEVSVQDNTETHRLANMCSVPPPKNA